MRLPEVLGYLLVGLAISPHFSGILTHDTVHALSFISDAAIGLIVFTIGAQLDLAKMRELGRPALRIALAQAAVVFVLVSLGTALCGIGLVPALLLGSLAVAAASPTTFIILQEYDCEGPLTRHLLVVVALNDIITLVLFRVVIAICLTLTGGTTSLATSAGTLAYQIAGSLALGVALGLILAWITQHEDNPSELFVVTLTTILLVVGGARAFGLSPMLCNLALGAAVANAARRSQGLLLAVKHTDPPVYITFFVLAGAELRLETLATAGVAGAAYILLRAVGKYLGGYIGARWVGAPSSVQANLGLALLPQAGVVIGLGATVGRFLPQYGLFVNALVLAGVVVYEFVGVLTLRLALRRAGEIGQAVSENLPSSDLSSIT